MPNTYARKRTHRSEHAEFASVFGEAGGGSDKQLGITRRRDLSTSGRGGKVAKTPKRDVTKVSNDENDDICLITPSPVVKRAKKAVSTSSKSAMVWAELDSVLENTTSRPRIPRTLSPLKLHHRPLPGQESLENLKEEVEVLDIEEDEEPVPESPRRDLKQKLRFLSSFNKRTYGGGRTFLDDSQGSGTVSGRSVVDSDDPETQQDLSEPEDDLDEEEQIDEEEEEEDELAIQNINDLKAQGANAEFISDVEYIMEGLTLGISGQQSMLIELLEKSEDPEFVVNFKTTQYPVDLFKKLRKAEDPVLSFLLVWFSAKLIADGSALALTLVNNYDLVELYLGMLQDDEEITEKKMPKSNLASLIELIAREQPDTSSSVKVSRQWVALNGLNCLLHNSASVAHVAIQSKIEDKASLILGILDNLLPDVLAHPERQGLANITLAVAVLTFIIQTSEYGSDELVKLMDEHTYPRTTNPIEKLVTVATFFYRPPDDNAMPQQRRGELTISVEVILKLAVMMSTQFASSGILHYSVYQVDLAVAMCDHLASHEFESLAGSLLVFTSGMLYNLVESEGICAAIRKLDKFDAFKDRILNYDSSHSEQNVKAALSYLYLVLEKVGLQNEDSQNLERLIATRMDATVAKLTSH